MVVCCVIGCHCDSTTVPQEIITFHKIPTNCELQAKWTRALEGISKKTGWICSQHFTKESFEEQSKGKSLRSEALPTLFACCPENLLRARRINQLSKPIDDISLNGTTYLKLFEDIPNAFNNDDSDLQIEIELMSSSDSEESTEEIGNSHINED